MKAALVVVIILAGVFGFLCAREREGLRAAESELAKLRGGTGSDGEQRGGAAGAAGLVGGGGGDAGAGGSGEVKVSGVAGKSGRLTVAEVERMKADQREAIRLRGEVANLKREVEEAKVSA